MAGDWIKMRKGLAKNWRVIQIAEELQIAELHVVGCLYELWCWADEETKDGNAIRVTEVTLDRFTGVTGFAQALRNAGWLTGSDRNLCLPNFLEHNGQTAKTRAETNKRVAKHRNAKCVTDVTPEPLPEKRREEKNILSLVCETELVSKLPDWMAPDWVRWMDHVFQTTGRHMTAIQQEAVAMEVMRRGSEKGLADLQFTIQKGAKTLQDASNDFSKQNSATTGRVGYRSKKEVSF